MFCKDNRQENLLTKFGVSWKYVNGVTFNQLSLNWEQSNFGRTTAINEAVVVEYAQRTEAGSSAPAPILRNGAKGYGVLDGVQRLSAKKLLGTTSFSAYIVDTDSDLLATQIRVLANHLLAGHPESAEWTRKQAVQLLILEGGMSIEEVARLGGWRTKDVEEDKLCMDLGFAIRCIGGPEKLPKGVLLKMAEHAKMDDFRAAPKPVADFCNDLKKGKFSNGDSEPFIKQFFSVNRASRKNLHEQFAKRLGDFRKDAEVAARLDGRSPQKRKGDIKLRSAMKSVVTITEELISAGSDILYVDEFFHLWNRVESNLKCLRDMKKKSAKA